MKYLGSKRRIGPLILPFIEREIRRRGPGCHYVEPFVGGANMISLIKHPNRIGGDSHFYLIELLKALSNGWIPPRALPENLYYLIRKAPDLFSAPLVGYAGFNLSFGSKWFDSYRRDKEGTDYGRQAFESVAKQIPTLQGIKFINSDFRKLKIPAGSVVYCDPPYFGTTRYSTSADGFPYRDFYRWIRALSADCSVFISEYEMPRGFRCIWEKPVTTDLSRERRVERLFVPE